MKIFGCACLTWWAWAILLGAANARETPPALHAGYGQVIRDLQHHWWDQNFSIPRIRPTRGSNSTATSLDVGTIDNAAANPSFWQMAQYANIQFWNWKITQSQTTKAQIASQWKYIRSVYSDQAISSSAKSFGIVNVSDDAAWELNYLIQVYEATGDGRALEDGAALLPNILQHFADPNAASVAYGSLKASPYGILYATPTDDPDHQGRSTSYEIMIADSALAMYQRNHKADYLNYAVGTYNWTKKYLKDPDRGFYYCELDIRPTVNGVTNQHFLVPMGNSRRPPLRGSGGSYSGGTLAMAVAAARLYKITGEQGYLDDAREITWDYVRPDVFLRTGNLLVNERDAWTDGYWAPYFADEVLTLPGVDATGLWKTAIVNTALSIISQRTADGFYGADWSGPERNRSGKSSTWIEQAKRGTGSGGGMALPGQIMTSSSSAAMVSAAELTDGHPSGK